MRNNLNNWGLNFIVREDDSLQIFCRYGCNQDFKFIGFTKRIVTAIPLEYLYYWVEELPEFNLEKYIAFISREFEVDLEVVDQKYMNSLMELKRREPFFLSLEDDDTEEDLLNEEGNKINEGGMISSESYVFVKQETNYNSDDNYYFYYIFCLLRHLYYYNISYEEVIEKLIESNYELKKQDFLSVLYKETLRDGDGMGYSLLPNSPGIMMPMFHWSIKNAVGNDKCVSFSLEFPGKIDLNTHELVVVNKNTEHSFKDLEGNYQNVIFEEKKRRNSFFSEEDIKKSKSKVIMINKDRRSSLMYYPKEWIKTNETMKEEQINFLQIRSRHPSHKPLRENPELKFKKKVLLRLGSTYRQSQRFDLELNSVDSIENSRNKRLMKECFFNSGVKTAPTFVINDKKEFEDLSSKEILQLEDLVFPIIAKNIYGSRGTGNTKIDDLESLEKFINKKNRVLNYYIFEKFMNYGKEYRVHVTKKHGAFLVWRKVRVKDTKKENFWFFNNSNCNWLGEENENFDTPLNYEQMLEEAHKALLATGLDIGGVDIRIQTNKNSIPKICVIEINSACALAEETQKKYIEAIKKEVGETYE